MSKLPQHWVRTSLGSICDGSQYGWTTKASNEGSVRFLRTTDITKGEIDWTSVPYCQDNPPDLDKYLIQENDILISRAGSVGFSSLMSRIPFSTVFASYLIRFVPSKYIEPRYVAHFLKSSEYWQQVFEASSGIALSNINAKKLSNISMPLSPLNEQKRIADKLDNLLARVDKCRDRLERTLIVLSDFRRAVLDLAMSGKLTEDWREENLDIEPVRELEEEESFDLAVSEDLLLLPSTWRWTALGDYANCSRGRFSARPRNDPTYFDGSHPFIQIGDLPNEGGWITSHHQTLNEQGLEVSKKFSRGTVVIAIVGSTIGNTGVLDYDMCFPDSLVGIDSGDKGSNRYIEFFLRYRKEEIRLTSYAGGGQPNIKLSILNPYPLPGCASKESGFAKLKLSN